MVLSLLAATDAAAHSGDALGARGSGLGSSSAPACGDRPGAIGLTYRAEPGPGADPRRVRLRVTATTAPVDPLKVEPVVMLGADVVHSGTILTLPCATPVHHVVRLPPGSAGRTLTVIFRTRPLVAPAVARARPDAVAQAFAGRIPPGLTSTPANLVIRLPGTRVSATASVGDARRLHRRLDADATPRLRGSRPARSFLFDPADDGAPRPRHVWVLAPDATELRFGVVVDPPRALPGGVAVACFLDDGVVAGFPAADASLHAASLASDSSAPRTSWVGRIDAGAAAAVHGVARIEAPGWHRLACLVWTNLEGDALDPTPLAIEAAYVHAGPW